MHKLILPILICGAVADDFTIEIEDPWTIASITILSFMFLLGLIRISMACISVSIETEEVEMAPRPSPV